MMLKTVGAKPIPCAGCCRWDAGAIFVNVGIRTYQRVNYFPDKYAEQIGYRFSWKIVKPTYHDYLYVLMHELVHWYFPEIEHGFEFDNIEPLF